MDAVVTDDLLAQSAAELFARHATPAAVRAILGGGPAGVLWSAVEEAGFADALVPEEAGGAGLGPADALPVLLAAGRAAAPLPLGGTMLARAALARAGMAVPSGAIALAEALPGEALRGRVAAHGAAEWVLLPRPGGARLLPVAEAERDDASPYGTVLRWASAGNAPTLPEADWMAAGAWATLAAMAGAMERILEETVRYATERRQFGRAIAAFQAVQQQISVMTEDVFAARIAAQLASLPGEGGTGVAGLDTARIAAAKARIGEAASRVAGIAHAVHGAMGITAEVDLHLWTGLLHRGRLRFGAESHWNAWLGAEFLRGAEAQSLAFVRARLAPPLAENRPAEETTP
ncbi:acyl-CoA dehydrogenase [Pseudoroseomonas rhizosphaerae]|uniref:Acyl-CoA dehydrogenase n=1 Tax=Teichococcus rhizosphaerae TaxID=1335062 RepID=A0A2C7AFI5_9PROT|nr:acyl-CoA dehydrogenase family protein [Pseudoroseomonas rhizosphaerae]PHK95447.1 acyl-CoA dehydrogenase [Pseudoroseomonas rhizosphaerae]